MVELEEHNNIMMNEERNLSQIHEAKDAQQETISALNRDIALENTARTMTTTERNTIKALMIAVIEHKGHANTDDLHKAINQSKATLRSPQAIGYIIRELIKENKINFVGWTKSTRPEAHRRDIKNYQLRLKK